jgi:hypothetical protein
VTNVQATNYIKERIAYLEEQIKGSILAVKAYGDECDALKLAVKALEEQTEVNIYDHEETYHNCTVQVLTNTVTGKTSVGWWQE